MKSSLPCSLVVCGNKTRTGGYAGKIKWLREALKPLEPVRIETNRLLFEYEGELFDLHLVQGEQDSIDVCNQVCGRREFVIIAGACGSLDWDLHIGAIFLPESTVNIRGYQHFFSPFLLESSARITERVCGTYEIGTILQARGVVRDESEIIGYEGSFSRTSVDQETSIIGTMCENTATQACAILYVSDNIPREQYFEVVNMNPTLFGDKIRGKKNSLKVAVETTLEYLIGHESS